MTRKLWILGLGLGLGLGLMVAGTLGTAAAAQEHFFSGIVLAVAPGQRLVSVEEASVAGAHRTFTIPKRRSRTQGRQHHRSVSSEGRRPGGHRV
jgi:hypothetical protein